MITPINNFQPKVTFQGVKFKMPKSFNSANKSSLINKASDKVSKFIDKTKTEFKNMDEETKDLLFKVVVGFTLLSAVIGTVSHYVCKIIDKFQELF